MSGDCVSIQIPPIPIVKLQSASTNGSELEKFAGWRGNRSSATVLQRVSPRTLLRISRGYTWSEGYQQYQPVLVSCPTLPSIASTCQVERYRDTYIYRAPVDMLHNTHLSNALASIAPPILLFPSSNGAQCSIFNPMIPSHHPPRPTSIRFLLKIFRAAHSIIAIQS